MHGHRKVKLKRVPVLFVIVPQISNSAFFPFRAQFQLFRFMGANLPNVAARCAAGCCHYVIVSHSFSFNCNCFALPAKHLHNGAFNTVFTYNSFGNYARNRININLM